MNDESPISLPRDQAERDALLRSTGELPTEKIPALDAALSHDQEAAAFADFIGRELLLAAKAPRDFAAAAIAAASESCEPAPRDFARIAIESVSPAPSKTLPFRRLLPALAAAAALIIAGFFIHHRQWTQPAGDLSPRITSSAVPPTRETQRISTSLAALESDLAQATARLSRSRYQHSTL